MNKFSLDSIIKLFFEDVKYINQFMIDRYGKENFIAKKNRGEIPERNSKVKDSKIERFYFHGKGCIFCMKNYNIDLEFDFDSQTFGVTEYSFSDFFKYYHFMTSNFKLRKYLEESNNLTYSEGVFIEIE